MKFRSDCAYALMAPSSMGVRITPADRQPVHISTLYRMQATSAETNVLSVSAALGLRVKVLTRFVKDSPIAQFIQGDLRRRGIDFEGKEIEQGGPWGYRHQFNIADSGYGLRAPRVLNDRAGEVGRTLSVHDFDLDRIFRKEGVQLLHVSGLIAALSPETSAFCLELVRTARQAGTLVSFDLNYRASFWKKREAELRAVFHEIASASDILIGNEEDFQLALGVPGPEAGGKNLKTGISGFQAMIERAQAMYPQVEMFATTLREVLSANEHAWGALVWNQGWIHIEPRLIPVLDRIGGGDGFVGGLLYGLLKGWTPERCAQFGWASGALATSLLDDFALPADEEQVWSIWEGNARVRR